MIKSRFAFHCHHDILVEYCFDYDERVKFIKNNKPLGEEGLRLRLFKLIPEDRLPKPLVKAGKVYHKARDAYLKAEPASLTKAEVAYGKARYKCLKTIQQHNQYLEELHKELCPDCPWNGKTIFPWVPDC